jgi:hypothetical protein
LSDKPESQAPEETIGDRLTARMGEFTMDRIGAMSLENAEANLPYIQSDDSVIGLQSTRLMEGNSALVIAAGPSLHRFDTARMIKESGYDGVIITTESSMSWCLRNDIVPDLVVTVDPHPDRIVRWFGDPNLSQEALDKDDYYERQDMDPALQRDQLEFNKQLIEQVNKYGPQMNIAVSSSASESVVGRVRESKMNAFWWNPFFDDYDEEDSITRKLQKSNGLPCLNAGGNVGTAAWVFAHAVLEKSHVGLLGLDFGYYGDTSYKQTQYYYELIDIVGEDNLPQVFTEIFNPFVDKNFFTDPTYLWYRNIFLELLEEAAKENVKTYNCTGGGTLFGEGVEFTSFETFVQASQDN